MSPLAEDEVDREGAGACPSYLIVVGGGLPGTMIRLGDAGAQIGRCAENSLQFIETTVSRRHAALSVDFNGHVGLTDLASTNGTYLNGQRLQPHASVWLRNGDRFRIGSAVVLKYVRLDPHDEKFQRELFERMVRDSLTGLFNRGYFQEQVGPLGGRSREAGLGLAILFIDVDHFKRVNDAHGHEAGDQVLREVARLLRESTRPDDLVSRYGGEEFVVALPVDSAELALERAERIRRAVAERPVRIGRRELRVSVSLGVSFGRSPGALTPQFLISEADEALYQAKREGRNRIVFHDAERSGGSAVPRPHVATHEQFDPAV